MDETILFCAQSLEMDECTDDVLMLGEMSRLCDMGTHLGKYICPCAVILSFLLFWTARAIMLLSSCSHVFCRAGHKYD